ncbi:MAG: DUF1592 domain-containing protein [Planctomycetota bacterium]
MNSKLLPPRIAARAVPCHDGASGEGELARAQSSRIWVGFVVTFACLSAVASTSAAEPVAKRQSSTTKDEASPLTHVQQAWKDRGWALLQEYCIDCHNPDFREAEIDLTVLEDPRQIHRHAELATHAINMVRFGAMPPEDAMVPEPEERRELGNGLDDLVFRSMCDLRPKPGRVTARRLNRAEYNNAIRDLFGIGFRPAENFPSDEVGAGFDNNADVLSVSTLLLEKYLDAAQQVTDRIIVDPDTLPSIETVFSSETLHVLGDFRHGRFGGHFMEEGALAWFEVDAPVGGLYQFEIRGMPATEVKGDHLFAMYDQTGTLQALFELRNRDRLNSNDYDSVKVRLEAGVHRFFVRPTGIAEDDVDLGRNEGPWRLGKSVWDRVSELNDKEVEASRFEDGEHIEPESRFDTDRYRHKVTRVQVTGPMSYDRDDLPPGQRELLVALAPRRGDQFYKAYEPAKRCLKPLMRMAFRRPVADDEVEPYAETVDLLTERGESYFSAMQVAISAVLTSPHFLFRVEAQDPKAKTATRELTSVELASRMSFFLWSSIPDHELLRMAEQRKLTRPSDRRREALRMLRDPRSGELGEQFAAQWFGLRNLEGLEFTMDDEDPSSVLAAETKRLFRHVLQNNRPVTELISADYTFVNEPLAKHYQIPFDASKADEDGWARVSVATLPRRGVLGHAGVLTLTSYPTRNSPVQRGKWILENILGTPPPEAPPGVPSLEETKTASASATLREQLELHREDPGCASCHRVMDSLGFGLEQFDHLGRLRAKDDPAMADATGELPGGRSFSGSRELAELLAATEARRFAETATRRLLTFALGRELRPADRCFIESILDAAEPDGYRLRDLVIEVIDSPPFLMRDSTGS